MRALSILSAVLCFFSLSAQTDCKTQVNHVQAVLGKLSPEMKPLRFTNTRFDVFTDGGHLQGVQMYESNGKKYLVATGSSLASSYYVVVELTKEGNQVVHYKEILPAPYVHAGGIQMLGTYLAVGVEDNQAKDKSKVLIFDLAAPGETDKTPLITIDREGTFKESTAGAVGFTCHDGQYLLAVSSWDSRTVDFYRSNLKPLGDPECKFTQVATWHQNTGDRSEWSSRWWPAYQGLNLLVDEADKVHMLGFYRNKDGNFIDHFNLKFDGPNQDVQFEKTNSQQFYCVRGASFRAGGGVYVNGPDNISILAISKKLKGKVMVNKFDMRK